jgi:hypothetical protein
VAAPAPVANAIDAVIPSAAQPMRPTRTMRYDVRASDGGFRVEEEGDAVADVATIDDARDAIYVRAHRRAFELASLAGWVRLHGALVDVGEARVLLTGASGSGKSTLTARMLIDGDRVQGDESVLVRDGEVVAVPRPLHLEPATAALVPEIAALLSRAPRVSGIAILDPGRHGFRWQLREAPLDHAIVLDRNPGPPGCVPIPQTEMMAALVPEAFRVTETKSALLRQLTAAVSGARCHRLAMSDPAAMRASILDATNVAG